MYKFATHLNKTNSFIRNNGFDRNLKRTMKTLPLAVPFRKKMTPSKFIYYCICIQEKLVTVNTCKNWFKKSEFSTQNTLLILNPLFS